MGNRCIIFLLSAGVTGRTAPIVPAMLLVAAGLGISMLFDKRK